MTDLTRRGALAVLGALAGCGATNPLGADESIELDGAALRALAVADAPTIPHRLPVDIEQSHLAAAQGRAETLLDAVPATLSPAEIPNGAIRERVQGARDHAAESLEQARERTAPFERLDALGDARADARFAADAWRAIDEGLTRDDLSSAAAAIRDDRAALHDRWAYVGGDPVDATLVHAAIERRLDSAQANATLSDPHRYRSGNPLGVGEAGEELERARVAVDDAAHFYDRYTRALDDPTDLRARLQAAQEDLSDAFETEREAIEVADPDRPWEVADSDIEDTPAAEALQDLARPLRAEVGGNQFDEGVARPLLWVHGSLIDLRAFRALRDRVQSGETFAIESVDDVAAMRTAAIEALNAANENPGVPALTRETLANLSSRLRDPEATLSNAEGDVRAASLRYDTATYLTVMARARATPPESERVATALRSG
ncbi:hypothetical protein [Haloplanus halobius]|uniref:hypothetical protein n=1 Tax=Haloplanus halobius TaxID=2934938 RepID=UPI00200CEB62|nr:hypothetical protein [Haloplanus sp. XH21]